MICQGVNLLQDNSAVPSKRRIPFIYARGRFMLWRYGPTRSWGSNRPQFSLVIGIKLLSQSYCNCSCKSLSRIRPSITSLKHSLNLFRLSIFINYCLYFFMLDSYMGDRDDFKARNEDDWGFFVLCEWRSFLYELRSQDYWDCLIWSIIYIYRFWDDLTLIILQTEAKKKWNNYFLTVSDRNQWQSACVSVFKSFGAKFQTHQIKKQTPTIFMFIRDIQSLDCPHQIQCLLWQFTQFSAFLIWQQLRRVLYKLLLQMGSKRVATIWL